MPNPRVLDVGCGWRKTPGAIGMDSLAESAADVIGDLNDRWPFEDGSFDGVVANHVLEHVPDMVHVMDEAWRVLVPGGRLTIRGPHFSSPDLVWSDPTHRRALSAAMFLHFQPSSAHPYGRGRFRIDRAYLRTAGGRPQNGGRWWRRVLKVAYSRYEDLVNRSPVEQQRAERMWSRLLPFDEVVVELIRVEP